MFLLRFPPVTNNTATTSRFKLGVGALGRTCRFVLVLAACSRESAGRITRVAVAGPIAFCVAVVQVGSRVGLIAMGLPWWGHWGRYKSLQIFRTGAGQNSGGTLRAGTLEEQGNNYLGIKRVWVA